MTATITPVDLDGVVKRADARWAGRQGDEPAAPEYLKVLADAVRPLLGQPPAGPVDDVQVQQLLDDKQRLGDLVAELRATTETRGKVIQQQKAALDQLKAELAGANRAADTSALREKLAAAGADVERLATLAAERASIIDRQNVELAEQRTAADEARADRDTARAQLRDRPADGSVRQKLIAAATDVTVREKLAAAAADVERFAGENRTLTERLAAAERDLAAANRTLDEIADEQDARPAAHRHQFEVDLSTGEHRPCECKQPWIRDLLEEDEPVVPDVEPLDALFGRIRSEAAEAGWTA